MTVTLMRDVGRVAVRTYDCVSLFGLQRRAKNPGKDNRSRLARNMYLLLVHPGLLSGLDREIDLQFVLHLHRAARGTDRLNPIVALLDHSSAQVSSIQFADG
jgi:hypothetical protein